MTELAEWQQSNERYLSAALTWLRLQLEEMAGHRSTAIVLPASSEAPAPPEPAQLASLPVSSPAQRRRWWQRHQTADIHPLAPIAPVPPLATTPVAAPMPVQTPVAAIEARDAETAMRAAEVSDPPPALVLLSQQLGLSRFEQDVLLLCAAMELDTRFPALCSRAQDDPLAPYPTFALALTLFEGPAWDALSPERPLRYWRLIEINQPGAQPLTTSPLRADERIVSYLKGLNYLDDRLAPLLTIATADAGSVQIAPSQRIAVDAILKRWRHAVPGQGLPFAQLLGSDAASKQMVAWHTANELGRQLYRMPAELLPAHTSDLETFSRLWHRESTLLPIALYLDAQEVETVQGGESQGVPVSRFLARSDGVIFLGTRESWPEVGRPTIAVEVSRPTTAEQRAAWEEAVPTPASVDAAALAGQFNLDLPAIHQITRDVLADADPTAPLDRQLWNACLASTRPRLDALAQRLEPKATWDDIALPEQEMRLLHQIAAQVGQRTRVYEEWGFGDKMSRGWGINALFTGESGVGKTMAAEVLANDLNLNLYRIDLSAVVSKYIGETEKNLRRLFDFAEGGGALLFFDEADALFGKRSEVKDSHDRYANIEINYLLQRMEAYRGLAILATNMKSALDTAFLRRLRFIVTFPFPSVEQRKTIWERVFPAGVPSADLDLDRLSRLPATGGMIHNIALNAAFVAARSGTAVTMPLVLEAARTEFQKLERPIPNREFQWNEPAGALP